MKDSTEDEIDRTNLDDFSNVGKIEENEIQKLKV